MAVLTGLEPAASGVTGRRYNQLNYSTLYIAPGPSQIFFIFGPLNFLPASF